MNEYGSYVAIGMLALAVLAYAIKLTWHVSRVEKDQREYTDAQVDNVQVNINAVNQGGLDRADSIRHETGEMGAALRTKIHETEVYMRDTFVRKESFEAVVTRIEKSMEKMGDRLEEKFDRAIERIERKV